MQAALSGTGCDALCAHLSDGLVLLTPGQLASQSVQARAVQTVSE